MKQQNFKNHHQWVVGYHFIMSIAVLALFIGSLVNLFTSSHENIYSASLIVLIAIILLFVFAFIRSFPLKAQDRAIRAEENFRHYLLTQKPLDSALTMAQIIGLRFASDKEFVALAERAVKENLSQDAIKKSIQEWRGDYYRV